MLYVEGVIWYVNGVIVFVEGVILYVKGVVIHVGGNKSSYKYQLQEYHSISFRALPSSGINILNFLLLQFILFFHLNLTLSIL